MIFGSAKAKIVFNGKDYLLDHSVLTPEFMIPDHKLMTSVLNGHRQLFIKGDYAEFTILVHLHKYADPAAKLLELFQLYPHEVFFYPHRDSNPIADIHSVPVPFIVTEFKPGYLHNYVDYDIVTLTLKSVDYIDIRSIVIAEPPAGGIDPNG